MSNKYEEERENDIENEDHEMIDGEEHEGHEELEEQEEDGSSSAGSPSSEAKKKKDKLFTVGAISVAVLVAGGLMAHKFGVFSSAPAPQRSPFDAPTAGSKPAGSAAQQNQDQQAQAILQGPGPSSMGPMGVAPGADPSAPQPGAVVAPLPPVPVMAPEGSVTVISQPGSGDQSVTVTPLAPSGSSSPSAPVAIAAAPSMNPEIPEAQKEGIERAVGDLSKKMDAIGEALKNFDGAKIESRLMSLEERMSALESGKKASGSIRAPSSSLEEKPASEVKVKRRAQRRVNRATRRVSDRQEQKAARSAEGSTLFSGNTSSVATPKSEPRAEIAERVEPVKTARDFTLQAVIPGRMWIKKDDGSSHSFAVGEKLPDGSKVVKIEADRNRVQTTSGSLQ